MSDGSRYVPLRGTNNFCPIAWLFFTWLSCCSSSICFCCVGSPIRLEDAFMGMLLIHGLFLRIDCQFIGCIALLRIGFSSVILQQLSRGSSRQTQSRQRRHPKRYVAESVQQQLHKWAKLMTWSLFSRHFILEIILWVHCYIWLISPLELLCSLHMYLLYTLG